MVRPGDLTGHSDFHLFKEGIKPMWEVRTESLRLPFSAGFVVVVMMFGVFCFFPFFSHVKVKRILKEFPLWRSGNESN